MQVRTYMEGVRTRNPSGSNDDSIETAAAAG
jgi:hypothetical protein